MKPQSEPILSLSDEQKLALRDALRVGAKRSSQTSHLVSIKPDQAENPEAKPKEVDFKVACFNS